MLAQLNKLRAQASSGPAFSPAAAAAPAAARLSQQPLPLAACAPLDLAALLRQHPLLELRRSARFGRALHAAADIAAGASVLTEAAFASVNPRHCTGGDDAQMVDAMRVLVGDGSLAAALPHFLQLQPANAAWARGELGAAAVSAGQLCAPCIHANGFTVRDDLQVLCVAAAMANHSCLPNVAVSCEVSGAQAALLSFTALRDIAAGEQIFHSYTDASAAREDRRSRLESYGFVCDCAACEPTG